MPRSLDLFQVDAFTRQKFAGNPAGVVLGAEQLNDAEMQAIARELNNGDTIFVLPASTADADLDVRFFTPRAEAAFVGHATLAAHAVLHHLKPTTMRRQKGKSGIVTVTSLDNGERFSIRTPAPHFGRILNAAEKTQLLEALGATGIGLDDLAPMQIMGSGSTRLMIALDHADSLALLTPQMQRLTELSMQLGTQGYFLFARRGAPPGCLTASRMFCPALGITEDPVSGNAHGMLGAYLLKHGLLSGEKGIARFSGAQGMHLHRPGQVDVSIETDANGQATAAHIAGAAVIVFRTQLSI